MDAPTITAVARIPARLDPSDTRAPHTTAQGVLVVRTVLQALALVRAVHDHPNGVQLEIQDREALLSQAHLWWREHRQIGMPAECPLPQWLDDLPPTTWGHCPPTAAQRLVLHIPQGRDGRGAVLAPPSIWTQILTACLETR